MNTNVTKTNSNRKLLSDNDVGQIRFNLFSHGESNSDVARQFGTTQSAISRIKNGLIHKDTFTRFIDNSHLTIPINEIEFRKWIAVKAKKYNMLFEDLLILVAASGGNCGICESQLILGPTNRHTRNREILCVDHKHVPFTVRGILCSSCNWSLGRSDPWHVKSTAYLDKYK